MKSNVYSLILGLGTLALCNNSFASGAKAPTSPSEEAAEEVADTGFENEGVDALDRAASDTLSKIKFGAFSELFKSTKFNGMKSVSGTIVISKAGVYDFKNVLHVWKGKNWSCNAQKENGPQILRVQASNVTIKNFAFIGDGKTHGSNGLGDPIHIASCGTGQGNTCGSNGPKNVVLDGIYGHACEDMLTVGTPGGSNITIRNSVLIAAPSKSAWDKTIQINFGKDINLYDNVFVGGVRCLRYKPQTTGAAEGNVFNGCQTAVQLSAKDADISPMKNGPSSVYLKSNTYNSGAVKCKDGGSIPTSGQATCK